MLDDESTIRPLIERWAGAAQAGDIEGVLIDHSADIVMFDVPPPEEGARGIEAYRQTWPPFSRRKGMAPLLRSSRSMSRPAPM